jgi:hypothetical protein
VSLVSLSLAPGLLVSPAPTPEQIGDLPIVVNLGLYQGDDFFLDLTVTDSSNNPINLSSYTPEAQIRGSPGAMVMAAFTATVDATTTNLIHLHLPHLQSMLLQRNAVWDCQITDSVGTVTTLVSGKVTTTLEVST